MNRIFNGKEVQSWIKTWTSLHFIDFPRNIYTRLLLVNTPNYLEFLVENLYYAI